MRIAVTGGSGKAGRAIVRDLLAHGHEVLNVDRVRVAGVVFAGLACAVPRRRPDRLRTDARGPEWRRAVAGNRGGRPSRGHSVARARDSRHRLPHEHDLDAHRVLGCRAPRSSPRGLGLERDDARAPVRRAAPLRPGRRGASAAAGVVVRALEGARRGDGPPVQSLERHHLRRPPLVERDGASRLRAVPIVLGRSAAPQVEPLELRRREPRRPTACGGRSPRTFAGPTRSSSPRPTRS